MALPKAKFYDEHRRIRVGKNKNREELTMRFFSRANKGKPSPTSSYSKTYIGLSDITVSQKEVSVWDLRYRNHPEAKRTSAIKEDWLGQYVSLDIAKDGNPTPSNKIRNQDGDEHTAKKQKTAHSDDIVGAFIDGKELNKAQYTRIGRQLQAKLALKSAPSNASELLKEMGDFRRVLGSAITPFDFFKWEMFLFSNLPDDSLNNCMTDSEDESIESHHQMGSERESHEADDPMDSESGSTKSDESMSNEEFLGMFLTDVEIQRLASVQDKLERLSR
ncbi:hypothetical protein BKA66DRAFT_572221 [Pyrenochaeta sp. MPI-SDFR-AT-0127]|nr:hypothetical protein BKA66DRAFT_572221 [Pyrenochaeta sp. MPI-SDFR-AT-0127]